MIQAETGLSTQAADNVTNQLAGRHGDAVNAVLAAVGYNFSLLLRWLALLLSAILAALAVAKPSNNA